MKKNLLYFLLIFIQIHLIYSQNKKWDDPIKRDFGDTAFNGFIASSETLFSNGVLVLLNKIFGFPWGSPTIEYIKNNFTVPWDWEAEDGFLINQMGHPYQGALYFTSGRINDFNFYESVFFSALGSFTWETFCESQHASINDFITTVTGSMALGEILYRLQMEAYSAGSPSRLVFFINPMGGFHILITNKITPKTGKNIYQLKTYFSTGYSKTNYSISDNDQEIFSFSGINGEIGLNIIYGNPFEQDTMIPYRHFELSLSIGMKHYDYQSYRIISDGYLFSFSPIYNEKNAMSTGLSMHIDVVSEGKADVYRSTIDQYSNALDWTIKYEHLFSDNTAIHLKYHAGFTFWGVSNYFSPYTNIHDLKNYGYGLNSKLFFDVGNKKLGKFESNLLCYALWPYSGTSEVSYGTVLWFFSDITYSHFISNKFSLGVTYSLAREWGIFEKYPDTTKKNDSVKLFIAWNL